MVLVYFILPDLFTNCKLCKIENGSSAFGVAVLPCLLILVGVVQSESTTNIFQYECMEMIQRIVCINKPFVKQ